MLKLVTIFFADVIWLSSVHPTGRREKVVCNLIFALAFLAILSSSSIISVSAYSASTHFASNEITISPLKVHYPITLTSPNAQAYGYFGWSAAISGNARGKIALGGSAIVGAPDETADGYSYAGNAYIFSARTGTFITALTSPNAQYNGEFGWSVAASGDLAIVGAPYETSGGYSQAGNAYVFNDTGSLIATLASPNVQDGGYFGYSVAIAGKFAIVGAPYETSGGYSQAGNAYVFNAKTGSLIATLTSPNVQAFGWFGWSVAISASAAGGPAIVGAPGETAYRLSEAGNAYVFSAKTGSLIGTLTSPHAQEGGGFGYSVGVSLTLELAMVGAPGETAAGYTESGNAYVFGTNGSLITTLSDPNAPYVDGYFGYSVAIAGEVSMVGAPGQADNYLDSGFAYAFNPITGSLITTFSSPNAQKGGNFGLSVSTTGRLWIAGAPGETADGYSSAGNAYIFE